MHQLLPGLFECALGLLAPGDVLDLQQQLLRTITVIEGGRDAHRRPDGPNALPLQAGLEVVVGQVAGE